MNVMRSYGTCFPSGATSGHKCHWPVNYFRTSLRASTAQRMPRRRYCKVEKLGLDSNACAGHGGEAKYWIFGDCQIRRQK
jgi:hypothetical protein